MLNRDQIELIHQEIDGANTPEESAAFRSLMEADAEAKALEAELRHVVRLFDRVGEREPPPRLKRAILDALPPQARAASRTESGWMTPGAIVRWFVFQLRLATERMEEAIMTKKTLLIGATALASVIVIAGLVTGFPPGRQEAGTIGGVEQAARYRGRAMTAADVTLKNPEIQVLFQNDQILRLVQSDVFRQVMASDAFRQAMASDAFRQEMASDAFRQAMANDAFRQLQAAEAFRSLSRSQQLSEAFMSEAMRVAH